MFAYERNIFVEFTINEIDRDTLFTQIKQQQLMQSDSMFKEEKNVNGKSPV